MSSTVLTALCCLLPNLPLLPFTCALIKDSDKLNAGKIPTIIGDSLLTPDPSTVVIIANKKATYFLDALVYSSSYVVEKSLVDKYGTNWTDHLITRAVAMVHSRSNRIPMARISSLCRTPTTMDPSRS